MNIKEEKTSYSDLYDALYKLGYHRNGKNHGVKFVKLICDKYKFSGILEVGCSNGNAVQAFKECGKNSYGIDISREAVKLAQEFFGVKNVQCANAQSLPFKNNSFEAIFSCDVLEHLEELD